MKSKLNEAIRLKGNAVKVVSTVLNLECMSCWVFNCKVTNYDYDLLHIYIYMLRMRHNRTLLYHFFLNLIKIHAITKIGVVSFELPPNTPDFQLF